MTISRAKNAKDAKIEFDKKRWKGRRLCELSVPFHWTQDMLGAINFLKLVL